MKHALELEVNGKFLTLFPDAKIKMIRKSPLFLSEADPGSRIYSFTIPAEPNAEILDFANLLFSNKKIATLDCKVWLKGVFYKKAKLDITGFTKETFDIRVRFDKPFYVEDGKRTLRSFEYNKPTTHRYYLPNFDFYIIETYYISGFPPAVDFSIDLQYQAPLKNGAMQTYTFNYLTSTAETCVDFMTRVCNFVNDRALIDGIFCSVHSTLGTNIIQLKFWSPFHKNGTLNIIWVLDLAASTELHNPTRINTSPNALTLWRSEITHANDTLANPQNYDYIFFPVYNPVGVIAPGATPGYNEVVNDYHPLATGVGLSFQGIDATLGGTIRGLQKQGFSPYAKLYDTLCFILKELKIELQDEFFDTELKNLVFFHNIVFSYSYLNGFVNTISSFKYSDTLPNITFGEFQRDFQKMFCLVFDFDSTFNSVRIISRKSILQSKKTFDATKYLVYDYVGKPEQANYALAYKWDTAEPLVKTRIKSLKELNRRDDVANFASLPVLADSYISDLIKVFKENIFYVFNYFGILDYSWQEYSESLEDYTPTSFSDTIITGLSTLFSKKFKHLYQSGSTKKVHWLLPYTEVPLNLSKKDDLPFSQRLLFYRGMVECDVLTFSGAAEDAGETVTATDAGSYPFASYHNYDFKGVKCGNYSLAWNAPDGLVNVWWKLWLDFINNTYPVTFQFDFTASQFMQLDLLEKLQVGNQQYLIDEMEVEITNEISLVTVKCYPYKTSE